MIKYSYALVNGSPVHISEVTEESREVNKYTCICCGDVMAAHINGKRRRHFQHYRETQHDYETYLHLTAKKIIKEAYENAISNNQPVFIEYYEKRLCNNYKPTTSLPCDLGKCYAKFDITLTHKEIHEEKPVGQFIPDLHLKSDKHKEIFIEIFVTHECEVEKAKSGYKIIEIRIKDEADLQQLSNLHFLRKNKNVKFHGFETKTVTAPFCKEDGCKMLHYDYILYFGKGRYDFGYDTLGYIMGLIQAHECKKYILRESKDDDFDYSSEDILYQLVWEMRMNYKLDLRTCIGCVNFQGREFTGHAGEPLRCKQFKNAIKITDAIDCNKYEVRQRKF